jgi:hypothetical protein
MPFANNEIGNRQLAICALSTVPKQQRGRNYHHRKRRLSRLYPAIQKSTRSSGNLKREKCSRRVLE